MATRGSLGGLATTTEEAADVLDAFGFDRILIETVGVGQTELDIARTAETTLLVLVPESGDGIQTLKAGVMEIADVYAVNKSDRPGADKLRQEVEVMLGIRRGNAFRHVTAHHGRDKRKDADRQTARPPDRLEWDPPVLGTIATTGDGIPELIEALDRHRAYLEASGRLMERRRERLRERTRAVVERHLREWIWRETPAAQLVTERLDAMVTGTRSPYDVAAEILDLLKVGAAQ
jgi:LAO/AO transport system kinase